MFGPFVVVLHALYYLTRGIYNTNFPLRHLPLFMIMYVKQEDLNLVRNYWYTTITLLRPLFYSVA